MSIHTVLQITRFTSTQQPQTQAQTQQQQQQKTITQNKKTATMNTNNVKHQQNKSQNNNNQLLNNDNETFSFQDFISEIINENDLKWHRLIIQDLERTIELKFREFKTQYNELDKIRIPADIFTKISKEILKSSLDEPSGILGARINIRLQLDGGKIIDLGRFAYDPTTLTTFEVFIILKEEVTSVKKLLHAFKLYSNFGKFLSTYIDGTNYEFSKRKLY